jgi:TM2 domain-containing membrane protein YozV
MNCYKHPDVAAVAFCRTCGRPLCQNCQQTVQGTIVCEEHAPQSVVPPSPEPVHPGTSPGLAFILGLIPGVGAIYNGQYAKGIVHVVIFGLLISLVSSGATHDFEPLFGLLIAIWYFYMPFEAFHTARRRQLGQPVDEFSSLFPMNSRRTGVPVGPIVLIGLGVLFLLNTMEILEFRQIARYWPVALIALGAYMLYNRVSGGCGPNGCCADPMSVSDREAQNEQR